MTGSTRRELLAGAAALALTARTPISAAARRRPESPALARARTRAIERPRPIVFNSDSDALNPPTSGTPAGLIANRFAALEHTEVRSVADSTGGTILMTHDTRAGERYDDFSDDPQRRLLCDANAICSTWVANMRSLRARGRDRLGVVDSWARRRRIEHIWSYRVNDVHDSFAEWELARWKRDHPDALLGSPGESADPNDPRYYWSALDFEQPRVRDLLSAIVADTLRTHRLDGVELDYYRAPLFFKPHLDLKPATGRQVQLMTSLQRRFRRTAYREGNRRGRPLLVTARVPETVERCLHCGIDIERWLREHLVDLLRVSGGYFPFTQPVSELIALGHRHGVPVHPTISASGMPAPYDTVEAWRGAAAINLRAGADGIFTFNFFPPRGDERLREIGLVRTLAYRDKVFAVEPARIDQGLTRNAIVQDQALPLAVPGSRRLPVGDDLAAAKRSRRLARATLQLQASAPVQVRLDNRPLTPTSTGGGWLSFDPDPALFRLGDNLVSVSGPAAMVTAIELTVGYR